MARRLRKTDGYAAWSKASSEGQLPSEGPAPDVERPLGEVLRESDPEEKPVEPAVQPVQPEVRRKSLPARYAELAERNFDLLVKEVDELEPRDRIRLQEHLTEKLYGTKVVLKTAAQEIDCDSLSPGVRRALIVLLEIVRGDRPPLTPEQNTLCEKLADCLEGEPQRLSLPAPVPDARAMDSPVVSEGGLSVLEGVVIPVIRDDESVEMIPATSGTQDAQAPAPTQAKAWYLDSIRNPRKPPK